MIKRMATCLPKEGVDANQFWNYHAQVHAADTVKAQGPTFKRYIMSRVTKVISRNPRFYDLTEMWYENEENMNKMYEIGKATMLPNRNSIYEDFNSWVVDNCSFILEQLIAKDTCPKINIDMQANKLIKRVITCTPKEEVDVDVFWEYQTHVHTPHILKLSGPGLKKYVISRVEKVKVWFKPKFYDITEMYWDSEESMNRDYEIWKNTIVSSGKSLLDEFNSWVTDTSDFMMEEFIAKEYCP